MGRTVLTTVFGVRSAVLDQFQFRVSRGQMFSFALELAPFAQPGARMSVGIGTFADLQRPNPLDPPRPNPPGELRFNDYAGGQLFTSRNNQPYQLARGDIGFQTLVDPSALAVPEPATWAMLITGFALVGAALRNRRRLGARSSG